VTQEQKNEENSVSRKQGRHHNGPNVKKLEKYPLKIGVFFVSMDI